MTGRARAIVRAVAVWSAIVLCAYAAQVHLDSQARDWPSERPPKPLPARSITFPPYEVRTLPNGLQVVVVLHHEQPAVGMRLLVRTGSAADPADRLGLAQLLSSLLDQGTTTKSAEELNEAIDFIGGEKSTGAASDVAFLATLVMKDSFEYGLRLLSDMARHPAFAAEEVERQRQQMLSSLQVSVENPEWVASTVFQRLVYGPHPYGVLDSGTTETLAALTRDDLLAFHGRYFAPNNAILAIVGDVTAAEAFSTVSRVFGDWARRDIPAAVVPQAPAPARRVIVVNKPDAVQTEIRVGNIGIPRKHDDFMALSLAVRILGGEGSNRLHQVLRTERGLTYGAQAVMSALKDGGDIQVQTSTRSETTAEAVRLIIDEIWRLQRERVREPELADAKAYITGSFPLTIETPGAIATQVVHSLFYGLPLDELNNYRERVNQVTAEDIQRAARRYLTPDRLSIVLVGNASAFTGQLRGIGLGGYETVDLSELDFLEPGFKRGAGRQGRPGARLSPLPILRPPS